MKRRLPGLREMYKKTPRGLCPFCLYPLPKVRTTPGRKQKNCLDPVCVTAYFRCYMRDRRRDNPEMKVQDRVHMAKWYQAQVATPLLRAAYNAREVTRRKRRLVLLRSM